MKSSVKSTAPATRKRDPEATRRSILKAAGSQFVDKGYAGTSMSDIAASAGVTKSLIHHHFGSKKQLWNALKRDLLAHYAEVQNEVLSRGDAADDVLERSVEALFSFLRSNRDFVRLSSWMDLEKDRRLASMAYPDLVSSGIRRIRLEQEAGRFRSDIEPEHLIAAMVSLCSHWFRARREFSSMYEGDIEQWDDSYQEAILKILRYGVDGGDGRKAVGGGESGDGG